MTPALGTWHVVCPDAHPLKREWLELSRVLTDLPLTPQLRHLPSVGGMPALKQSDQLLDCSQVVECVLPKVGII